MKDLGSLTLAPHPEGAEDPKSGLIRKDRKPGTRPLFQGSKLNLGHADQRPRPGTLNRLPIPITIGKDTITTKTELLHWLERRRFGRKGIGL